MLKCKSNLSIPLAAKFISGTALLETGKERFVHRGRGLHGDYCDCNCPVMYPVKPHRLKDTEACSEHQNCLASLFMHVAVLPWPKSNYFSLQNMIFFFFFFILEYISPLILVQLYCMAVGWSQNSFLFWKARNCSWFQALGIMRTKIIPLPHYQDCSCLLWNSLEKLAVRIDSFAVLCLPSLLPWSLRLLLFSLSPSQLLRGTCVTPCARMWAAGAQGPSTASPAGFLVARRSVWNSATSCKGKGPEGCLGFWQWFGGGGYWF